MQKKPEPVATLSPEQLARYNAWLREEQVINETARAAMQALIFSVRADKRKNIEESRSMWKQFEEQFKLDPSKCYLVDEKTGEITTHIHGPMLVIGNLDAVMGGGGDSSGDPTKHH